MENLSRLTDSATKFSRKITLGVWIIFLYMFFVAIVFLGFGSYIYRSELRTELKTEASDGLASVDTLFFLVQRETDLNFLAEGLAAEIRRIDADIKENESLLSALDSDRVAIQTRLRLVVSEATELIRNEQANLIPADGERLRQALDVLNQDLQDAAGRASIMLQSAGILETVPAEYSADLRGRMNDMSESLRAVTANLAKLEFEAVQLRIIVEDARRIRQTPATKHSAISRGLKEIENVLAPSSAYRARINRICGELWVQKLSCIAVSLPTIFQTLIVTIATGALGAVVAFSRRLYSTQEDIGLSRLFVNIGEGIAAALAIFLFSRAGMQALTQGTGPASNVELSPYSVAFVAFVSGLMAESAFARIQSAGKQLFKDEN